MVDIQQTQLRHFFPAAGKLIIHEAIELLSARENTITSSLYLYLSSLLYN